jgi:hypothetical protein
MLIRAGIKGSGLSFRVARPGAGKLRPANLPAESLIFSGSCSRALWSERVKQKREPGTGQAVTFRPLGGLIVESDESRTRPATDETS